MTLYLHGKYVNTQGESSCFWCTEVESKKAPMLHHEAGLQYTATGYGSRIPTETMIKFNGRWRRVYCYIYSNCGTLYIGKMHATGEVITVQDYKNNSCNI